MERLFRIIAVTSECYHSCSYKTRAEGNFSLTHTHTIHTLKGVVKLEAKIGVMCVYVRSVASDSCDPMDLSQQEY